jgi:ferredoxin
MKKIVVDANLCTGCGLCVDICPEVFEMKDDLSVVKTSDVSGDIAEKVKEAQESCPVEAIIIEE